MKKHLTLVGLLAIVIVLSLSATEAVRRAVDNANPRNALGALNRPLSYDAREALIDLLQAQASFHFRAGGLERRGLRRTPPT